MRASGRAGETAGGIHGGNRIGGSAISSALVFGRLAGRAAAAEARSRPSDVTAREFGIPAGDHAWIAALLERTVGLPQADVRLHCRMVAHEQLGPLRDASGLQDALAELARIEREDVPRMRLAPEAGTSDKVRGHELESALSVRNLALLGRLVAEAALRREESRGAHYRLDFPHPDDARWRAVTRLERTADGGVAVDSSRWRTAEQRRSPTGQGPRAHLLGWSSPPVQRPRSGTSW